MPGDKMIILAEGQGPIFADKLRFFRTMPFREMERFSQAHLPDVPATEYLPRRSVPATRAAYAGDEPNDATAEEQKPEPKKKAKSSTERQLETLHLPASQPEKQSPLPDVVSPQAHRARSAAPDALNASFVKAARRLKSLAKVAPKHGSQRNEAKSWGRIFDETIPDELEIAEAGAV